MPHTLSYCALIGKCALIRSNTVYRNLSCISDLCILKSMHINQLKIPHVNIGGTSFELNP